MPRQRKGTTSKRKDGSWWARLIYFDDHGKHHDLRRRAENKTEANDLREDLLEQYDRGGSRLFAAENKTFADLCDYFEEHYLIEPVYHEGRKIAGFRSFTSQKWRLATLKEHFGPKRLRSLTHEDLRAFRVNRLQTPMKWRKGARSIASVNRELALLRRMLNVAQSQGWILQTPFKAGDPLISIADEKQRERILTREEETRLLGACEGKAKHLRSIIIAALDTGCRQGELLKLKWRDIDFESRTIVIQAFNTKTMRERNLALTTRLYVELQKLWQASDQSPDALVFGIQDNVKRSFQTVRKNAGLPDLRFHDLRHTAATRLVSLHMPLPEVGRVLGHTQPQTTYRYMNLTIDTAKRAAQKFDAFASGVSVETTIEATATVN